MSITVLVVDDEKEIVNLVGLYLENEGYDVQKAYSATEALDFVEKRIPNLAILDVMLPDLDGFALCCKLREKYMFPIIMLTAKIDAMEKITGLTLGADDYMTKPFFPLELVARVKTQLRRSMVYNPNSQCVPDDEEYNIKGLRICKSSRKCWLNEEELVLTPIEFDLLWYLSKNRGKVIPSEELFEAVWKEKYFDSNNTVMTHIARLRDKMHEPSRKPKYIKTVWGIGYTIE